MNSNLHAYKSEKFKKIYYFINYIKKDNLVLNLL